MIDLMNQRTAQRLFIGLNVLAIPIVLYPVFELCRVAIEVFDRNSEVRYYSGDFHFLLMSVFWVMWIIQRTGRKGDREWVAKKAQKLLIGWFIGCLALAALIPLGLEYGLTKAGYQECEPPGNPAYRMGGRDMRFSLTACVKQVGTKFTPSLIKT